MHPDVLRVADVAAGAIDRLLSRFGLGARRVADGEPIPASFWGAPEAGIDGTTVSFRCDTPVHSLLHETCHVVCMSEDRRAGFSTNAGGDAIEEAAVCYLQILLADHLPGVGRMRLMQDMDAWGYSFRLGSTGRWFVWDAADAADWLQDKGLLTPQNEPAFRLRGA